MHTLNVWRGPLHGAFSCACSPHAHPRTVLQELCHSGNGAGLEGARWLLRHCGGSRARVNSTGGNGPAPLIAACAGKHIATAWMLIQVGLADCVIVDGPSGTTPLRALLQAATDKRSDSGDHGQLTALVCLLVARGSPVPSRSQEVRSTGAVPTCHGVIVLLCPQSDCCIWLDSP